jgi:hypothetical protein
LHRNDEGAVENPGNALPPMEAHTLRIVYSLPPGDTDGVFLGLDIHHSRQLDDGDEVISFRSEALSEQLGRKTG